MTKKITKKQVRERLLKTLEAQQSRSRKKSIDTNIKQKFKELTNEMPKHVAHVAPNASGASDMVASTVDWCCHFVTGKNDNACLKGVELGLMFQCGEIKIWAKEPGKPGAIR